jgi:Domain of unknown function (DUF4160)
VFIIGELDRFDGIIVRIYPEKGGRHNIPHIHVYYNEYSCTISIVDGKMLEGNLPNKQKIILYQWLIKYKEIILLKWIELMEGKSINKIER